MPLLVDSLELDHYTTIERDAIASPNLYEAIVNSDTGRIELYDGVRWTGYSPQSATGVQLPFKAITDADSPYAITTADYIVSVAATSGSVVLTLPPSSSALVGGKSSKFEIYRSDNTGNTVELFGDGSELVNGDPSQSLVTQYDSVTVASDGVGWMVL